MAGRQELEALRSLQAARVAGDERAELVALRTVQAARQTQSPSGPPGAAVPIVSPGFRGLLGLRGLMEPVETSFGEAFARGAGNRVANSALNLAERGVNAVANIPGRAANMLLADPISGAAPFGRVPEVNVNLPRAEELSGIFRPTEERPVATALGQTTGDVASLLAFRGAGRAGMARINPQAAMRIPGVAQTVQAFRTAAEKPGTARALDQFFSSRASSATGAALKNAAETGAEGAALAILNEGDPLQVGALAAGGQLAGTAAIGLTRRKRILWTALTAAGGIQLAKSFLPGGKDFALESIESGFDSARDTLIAAAGARLIGAGRIRSENFPFLRDIPTIQRGAVLSVVNDALSESERGGGNVERALQHLLSDAEQFSDEQISKIDRGIKQGNLGSTLSQMVDKDKDFARLIDSPLQDPGEVTQRHLNSAIEVDNGPSAAQVVVDMRNTASALKRRLPAGLRERLDSLAPQAAIARALEGGDDVLAKLSTRQRRDALEVNLSELISRSMVRSRDRRIVDPQRLEQQWQQLSNSVRDAYSPRQREAIERFIDEARAAPNGLAVLPQTLSSSLMVDGDLSRRLLGESEE